MDQVARADIARATVTRLDRGIVINGQNTIGFPRAEGHVVEWKCEIHGHLWKPPSRCCVFCEAEVV